MPWRQRPTQSITFRRSWCLKIVSQLSFQCLIYQENISFYISWKKTNVHQVISLQLLDVGTSTLRFSDMDYFLGVCPEFICKKNTKLRVKEDMRFSTIISSTSCVVTIAKSDTNKETVQLVDFMNVMNVEKKHLYIHMSSGMESYTFKNKSINFNVVIDHESKGVFNCSMCIE